MSQEVTRGEKDRNREGESVAEAKEYPLVAFLTQGRPEVGVDKHGGRVLTSL